MANREFNPKNFLVIFASLSLAALFLFLVSDFGTRAYSHFFEEETYGEGVVIASIPLEDVTQKEAISLVNDRILQWKDSHPVYIRYNDQKVKLNADVWLFQNEESVKDINGISNQLQLSLNEEAVRKSLSELQVSGLDKLLEEDRLFAYLKQMGATLQTKDTEVDINEFLITFGQAEEVVSEGTIKLPGENLLLKNWLKGLEGYEIKPGASFSLIGAIEEVGFSAQDSIDINVLASGVYTAVQKTNFTIVERHTSRELPDYTALGFEAYVKPAEMDFAFENPNATSYKLNFTVSENKLTVSIVGIPLPYTYMVKVDKQVFEPKTIIHFNDQLSSIFSSVLVNGGSEGYLATVYRESFGSGGESVEKTKLAEDFYPPKHRIEERGYPVEEKEETNSTSLVTGEDGTPVLPYPYPYPTYPNIPYPTNPYVPVIPGIPGTKIPEQSDE
jgi:VanW like protein